MRHRVRGRKLGRTTAHRTAMFRNQLISLFTHERIVTTVAKAKELRPVAERMVTLARTGTLPARRKVATMVPDNAVVQRLFEEIAPRFVGRPGGYTRIVRLGIRKGDCAEMALIEFIDFELSDKNDKKGGSDRKPSLMDRAKGMLGGKKAPADEVEPAEVESEEGGPEEEAAPEAEEAVAESPAEDEPAVAEQVEEVAEETTDDAEEKPAE